MVTVIARNRHQILARISSVVQRARAHARPRVVTLAERARNIVLSRLSAGTESDLLELASSDLPSEKWLEKIIRQGSEAVAARTTSNRTAAILLLDDSSRIQN
jgi:hypothetical protein